MDIFWQVHETYDYYDSRKLWTFAFHSTIALCECVKLKFGKGFLLGGVPLLPKNTFIGNFSPVIPSEMKKFQHFPWALIVTFITNFLPFIFNETKEFLTSAWSFILCLTQFFQISRDCNPKELDGQARSWYRIFFLETPNFSSSPVPSFQNAFLTFPHACLDISRFDNLLQMLVLDSRSAFSICCPWQIWTQNCSLAQLLDKKWAWEFVQKNRPHGCVKYYVLWIFATLQITQYDIGIKNCEIWDQTVWSWYQNCGMWW